MASDCGLPGSTVQHVVLDVVQYCKKGCTNPRHHTTLVATFVQQHILFVSPQFGNFFMSSFSGTKNSVNTSYIMALFSYIYCMKILLK